MPTTRHLLSVCCLILLMLMTTISSADELILVSGDRLSGTVVREEEGALVFKTEYAGELSIALEHIDTVRTDEPLQIETRDKTVYSASEIRLEGDDLVITGSQGTVRVDKSNLYLAQPESEVIYTGWRRSGRVNFGLNYNRGNSNTDILSADFDARFRKPADRIRFTGQWDNQRVDGVDAVKKWFIDGNYNHFVSKEWYTGAVLRMEHDEFANLDDRIIAGPLVGHQFYESEPLNLLLEVGLMYVREDFATEPVDKYWGPSWHLLFDKYILGVSGLQFYHEQSGLVSAENTDKVLWDSWTGLRMPLYGGILASAEIEIDYNSEPAPGTESTNSIYRIKLGYQW